VCLSIESDWEMDTVTKPMTIICHSALTDSQPNLCVFLLYPPNIQGLVINHSVLSSPYLHHSCVYLGVSPKAIQHLPWVMPSVFCPLKPHLYTFQF
jgi:hypothetical protein